MTCPSVAVRAMEPLRYHHLDLLEYACRVLERLDVPPDDARETSSCLLKAELRGVDSHGLVRLPVYARRIQKGVVNARPDIRIASRTGATALLDGGNGLGPVVGSRAMDETLALAATYGTGFVGVRHSNHFGPAAYYVEKAIAAGCVGLAISNAPPNMAPFGGKARFLGTNPVAIGIPAGRESPLIFDASTSVVARGKIIVAAQTGKAIPEGWAVDPEGHSTTDANLALAGAMLPFGGPKGSALSFIIDIACGVLTGAAFASHLNTLEDLSSVTERWTCAGRDANGSLHDRRRVPEPYGRDPGHARKQRPPGLVSIGSSFPGEIELANEARLREQGIELPAQIAADLARFGESLGVAFPPAYPPGIRRRREHEHGLRPDVQLPPHSDGRPLRVRNVSVGCRNSCDRSAGTTHSSSQILAFAARASSTR